MIYMRKLLSKKAGAFFNSETQQITFVVKKENIEIVGKIKSGLYVVLYLVRTGNDKGMLFANWEHFFSWMTGAKEQMALISKHCPKCYNVLIGKDEDGVAMMNIARKGGDDTMSGMGMPIDLPDGVPLINCMDEKMMDKAEAMMNKMIEIYSEFQNGECPEEWREALVEVWG